MVTSSPVIKALGVVFQPSLGWDHHIKIMLGQLAYKLTVLRQLRPLMDFKTIRMIATSIVPGKIGYALPLWGHITQYNQDKFQTILLTAARICLGPGHARASTHKLLEMMGWLSFPKMVEYFTSRILHQTLTTGTPESLSSKIPEPKAGNTRQAKNADIMIRRRRLLRSKRTIFHDGLLSYNQLSKNHKKIAQNKKFARKMKDFLKNSRTSYVKNYSLSLIKPPPAISPSITDTELISMPNGSLRRVQIPLRQYLCKFL